MLDIYSINYDGNLIDAGNIAAIAALKTAKLPKYNEETGKVEYGVLTNKPVPLTDKLPINITFHKIGEKILVDPSAEEEESSEARVSFALTRGEKKGEMLINAAQKGEGKIFTQEEMFKILDIVEEKYIEIEEKLKDVKN